MPIDYQAASIPLSSAYYIKKDNFSILFAIFCQPLLSLLPVVSYTSSLETFKVKAHLKHVLVSILGLQVLW